MNINQVFISVVSFVIIAVNVITAIIMNPAFLLKIRLRRSKDIEDIMKNKYFEQMSLVKKYTGLKMTIVVFQVMAMVARLNLDKKFRTEFIKLLKERVRDNEKEISMLDRSISDELSLIEDNKIREDLETNLWVARQIL